MGREPEGLICPHLPALNVGIIPEAMAFIEQRKNISEHTKSGEARVQMEPGSLGQRC